MLTLIVVAMFVFYFTTGYPMVRLFLALTWPFFMIAKLTDNGPAYKDAVRNLLYQ